jgi:hypothetical protein
MELINIIWSSLAVVMVAMNIFARHQGDHDAFLSIFVGALQSLIGLVALSMLT